MAMKEERIIYYEDELNDDFAGTKIKVKPLGDQFEYLPSGFRWNFFSKYLYFVVARPLIWLSLVFLYHQKYVGKKNLKKMGKNGAFIYGNHTQVSADAFIPNLLCYHRNYILTSREAVSIPGIRNLVMMLGVIPLADSFSRAKQMRQCMAYHLKKGRTITIFPEAHIWPYYTKIRPFKETSFKYPLKDNLPCYALTNCYQKRRFGKRAKIITFIDGPFYPDPKLDKEDAAKELRNRIYEVMKERTETYSTYEYISYRKK